MHGGKCRDFGSGLNCSCADGYTGIGCQYEYDACQANACQNGATCTNDPSGFKCVCAPGFTGKYCDEDVIDCKENSCPPSATCIDLTDKFYCQCPFNLTGEDCRKSKLRDNYLFSTINQFFLKPFRSTTTCTSAMPLGAQLHNRYHSTRARKQALLLPCGFNLVKRTKMVSFSLCTPYRKCNLVR